MRGALAGLFVSGLLFGQAPFDRLQREAARTRALFSEKDQPEEPAVAVTALRVALGDWIESELPRKIPTKGELLNLETALNGELKGAGLSEPETSVPDPIGPEGPGLGYVGLEFKRFPELPGTLAVIVSVTVGCGSEDAVLLYRFQEGGRTRVLEDHPQSAWGYGAPDLKLSDPDSSERRLVLVHYLSVQCASTWMGMAYSIYRLDAQTGASQLLIADTHGFWLGREPEFLVKPQELIIESLDMSVDGAIHNRTRIHRYGFAEGVQRLDPIALQPQDFAEEWLTRDWNEMESRSAAETREWHDRLHSDVVSGEYSGAITCANQGHWLIALDIMPTSDDERPQTPYFLVRDLGNYRYKMDQVSISRPAECPGASLAGDAGFASNEHPWLSVAELRDLR